MVIGCKICVKKGVNERKLKERGRGRTEKRVRRMAKRGREPCGRQKGMEGKIVLREGKGRERKED